MNKCPDLTAAIRDLHVAIIALTDELRQHRQVEQASIEAIRALHQKPVSSEETHNEQEELPYANQN